eukprot:190175-Prorocentrum_minimum.AAC.6
MDASPRHRRNSAANVWDHPNRYVQNMNTLAQVSARLLSLFKNSDAFCKFTSFRLISEIYASVTSLLGKYQDGYSPR